MTTTISTVGAPATIVLAQINLIVGDIAGNVAKILKACQQAKQQWQAQLIVFPELTICGYLAEDLMLRSDFLQACQQALQQIQLQVTDIDIIVGYPLVTAHGIQNAASYIRHGKIIATYAKQELPNYGIFDEKRYFTVGNQPAIVEFNGHKLAIAICEDLWHPTVAQQAKQAGADLIVSINASPFDYYNIQRRKQVIQQRAQENAIAIIYTANIGGHDEVIFDGGSFAVDTQGQTCVQGPMFEETLIPVQLTKHLQPLPGLNIPAPAPLAMLYQALVLAVRDYTYKNHFKRVMLGVSGGIDSAVVLAIAVDALGADNVHAVFLPSRYNSAMSMEDSIKLCENLGVAYSTISIEPIFNAFTTALADEFHELAADKTEENIQARCRGTLLMAISNKKGALLLTTGNKDEMAVGYATLYGDMAGGFAVIKDVFKMDVYALANYRNQIAPVIPQRIIDRPPSAELAPDQTDQDTLPPYPILDAILRAYLEQDQSLAQITALGFDENTVRQVIHMVNVNEYKRYQAAPGPKVSPRAFGRERRYPIVNGFR
jgi:NAD+ synthase (glutamine-hydrolysing)